MDNKNYVQSVVIFYRSIIKKLNQNINRALVDDEFKKDHKEKDNERYDNLKLVLQFFKSVEEMCKLFKDGKTVNAATIKNKLLEVPRKDYLMPFEPLLAKIGGLNSKPKEQKLNEVLALKNESMKEVHEHNKDIIDWANVTF